MVRFAPRQQADLFASPVQPAPQRIDLDPLTELRALLQRLRGAEQLPWADAAEAMAEERRALGLASMAGPEGERLVAAILEESERLFVAAER